MSDENGLKMLKSLEKQLKLAQDILKASNVEEVLNLRNNSDLFKREPSNIAKQTTIEEYREMAQEAIIMYKKILGETNGNN